MTKRTGAIQIDLLEKMRGLVERATDDPEERARLQYMFLAGASIAGAQLLGDVYAGMTLEAAMERLLVMVDPASHFAATVN